MHSVVGPKKRKAALRVIVAFAIDYCTVWKTMLYTQAKAVHVNMGINL